MKTITYTNIRKNLAQVMSEVCDDKITAHITRRNGENCVLMSEDEYLSMCETLYLFNNANNARHLAQSFQEADNNQFVQIDL